MRRCGAGRRGSGPGQAGDVLVAEVVALRAEPLEQRDRAGGGVVEADRVADPGVLGRVRGQDERQPLLGCRYVAQPGVAYGDARDPRGTLRVGHVGRQTVGVDLLEGERHRDEPAVELGHGDLARGVERGDPLVVLLPVGAGRGEAQRLDDRYVQAGEGARVPCLVVAARSGLGGFGAARREHRRHDGVGGAEFLDELGFGGAERGHVEGERPAAGRFDGVAERRGEGGVAAHVVGPVVEDGDGGGRPRGGGAAAARRRGPARRPGVCGWPVRGPGGPRPGRVPGARNRVR